MFTQAPRHAELRETWVEGDARGRWRSGAGHGPGVGAQASGSSILELDPGCVLPRHTDSAEELIVIVAGAAKVIVGDETATAGQGAIVLVPEGVPHEVHNARGVPLRFWAVYASPEVTTTYEEPVQPDGERERSPIG